MASAANHTLSPRATAVMESDSRLPNHMDVLWSVLGNYDSTRVGSPNFDYAHMEADLNAALERLPASSQTSNPFPNADAMLRHFNAGPEAMSRLVDAHKGAAARVERRHFLSGFGRGIKDLVTHTPTTNPPPCGMQYVINGDCRTKEFCRLQCANPRTTMFPYYTCKKYMPHGSCPQYWTTPGFGPTPVPEPTSA